MEAATTPEAPLKRRNSTGTPPPAAPSKLILPSKLHRRISSSFPNPNPTAASATSSSSSSTSSSSFPIADFDLASLKSLSYTSLKDLIPSAGALNSPTSASGVHSEISIRNRLVKQAACAYLLPLSTAASPASTTRCLWRRFSVFHNPFNDCFSFISWRVSRVLENALDRFLRVFGCW